VEKSRPQGLTKLAKAAQSALRNSKTTEISHWIGTGPSIRARARLALLVAFMIATPTLFIGVKRSEDVGKYADSLIVYDQFWERISAAQLSVEKTRSALWRVEAEPEIENERGLKFEVEEMRLTIMQMISRKPKDFASQSLRQMEDLTLRVFDGVEAALRQNTADPDPLRWRSLSLSRLAMVSLADDMESLERDVSKIVEVRRKAAVDAMSNVSRDQLFLFLVLLFLIPVFILFVPAWLVAPLVRLKRIEQRIEEGRIRELAVFGNDEVSQLARAIKEALIWREELDVRKSTKIFEIRNVLRAVIARVNEPVLIIDRTGRINYANQPASDLLQVETHYLEGSGLSDHFFSTQVSKAFADALNGDIDEEGIKASLEFRDGRVVPLIARLSAVHDRAGMVSRVVIVLISAEA
jgi:PAS domain-containing protein